jgi:hypothetical protein
MVLILYQSCCHSAFCYVDNDKYHDGIHVLINMTVISK